MRVRLTWGRATADTTHPPGAEIDVADDEGERMIADGGAVAVEVREVATAERKMEKARK